MRARRRIRKLKYKLLQFRKKMPNRLLKFNKKCLLLQFKLKLQLQLNRLPKLLKRLKLSNQSLKLKSQPHLLQRKMVTKRKSLLRLFKHQRFKPRSKLFKLPPLKLSQLITKRLPFMMISMMDQMQKMPKSWNRSLLLRTNLECKWKHHKELQHQVGNQSNMTLKKFNLIMKLLTIS